MPTISTFLVLLLLHKQEQNGQLTFRQRQSLQARRRRDRRVTRRALQSPSMSPFMVLFQSMCDQSMITVTGLDHASFLYLLRGFEPLYNRYTPYSSDGNIRLIPTRQIRRGRPRTMNAVQCLGLLLAWHRTRGSTFTLSMLFGVTGSVCSLFIRFARRLLLQVMSSDNKAKVIMPDAEVMESFKKAIGDKYHPLADVYCVADGLKLYLEQSGDFVIQNMFYNGWNHDHYVGNVLVFAPNGTIIACSVNAPASMHDSQIAEWGGVYSKLEQCFEMHGGRCVVDSAFAQGQYPFLIKSAQDETQAEGPHEVVMIRQATSVRQSAEWGMRAFQGSFPRMKDRFIYEEHGERKLMLLCTVHLFNLRTRLVGLNQILSTYMPNMSIEVNLFLHNELHI